MQNLFTSRRLWLEPGEVASLRATQPLSLQIFRGRVWITMEGGSADYWLCGGQSMDIAGRGLLVIEAVDAVSKLEIRRRRRHWTGPAALAVAALAGRLQGRNRPIADPPAACHS